MSELNAGIEVKFKRAPKAFLLEADNHPGFIDSLSQHGWRVVPSDGKVSFDLTLVSEDGWEAELYNGEWIVIYDRGDGKFTEGEPFCKADFEKRFTQ